MTSRANLKSQIFSQILRPSFDILDSLAGIYDQGRAVTVNGSSTPNSTDTSGNQNNAQYNQNRPNTLLSGAGVDQSITSTFGTVSGATRPTKPFIVGIIPPDVAINFIPIQTTATEVAGFTGVSPSTDPANSPTNPTGVNPASGLPDSFYRALAQTAKNINANPADLLAVLYAESGLNPQAANHVDNDPSKSVQARGLNQITPVACPLAHMSNDFWQNQYSNLSAEEQLPYVQNYFKGCYKGPYINAAQLYVVNFAPAYVAQAADPNFPLYKSPSNNYDQNKGLDKGNKGYISAGDMAVAVQNTMDKTGYQAQLARMISVIGQSEALDRPGITQDNTGKLSADAPATGGLIMSNGNITSPEEDDPLNRTGRNITIADQKRQEVINRQIQEIQQQIQRMIATPALAMLINPQEFSRSFEHQVDSPKGRRGHIVNMWLEKPMTISCKGVTAAQYAIAADGSGGITHQRRIYSLSYQNLMSLVMLYRNNGYIYTQATSGSDTNNWGIPVLAAGIYIYYDGHIYIGSFDDFSVTDAADKPFNLAYSWKFTVRFDLDVSQITDSAVNLGFQSNAALQALAGIATLTPSTSTNNAITQSQTGQLPQIVPDTDPSSQNNAIASLNAANLGAQSS